MVMDVGICVLWSLFADRENFLGISSDCNPINQGLAIKNPIFLDCKLANQGLRLD